MSGTEGGTPEHDSAQQDWRGWMRDLGQRVRTAREAVRLSQSDLALAAGVSQGAISRLETGRGLATPLLVVLKTAIALRDAARRIGPEAMPREMAPLVESLARHVGRDGHYADSDVAIDPAALELVSTYRALPERERQDLLEAARRTAAEAARPSARA